jgi:deazaflavin-dependent oxidoreductase (nitroreductase family)
MAKTSPVPTFVRVANAMTTALLKAGVPVANGGNPMYLLTVRGRKSGLPRTTPIVAILQDGQRYLFSPYGQVDWVRNLRAAGEATLTRGRHIEKVWAIELPINEAGLVLKKGMEHGIPSYLAKYFEVPADASLEEFERAAARHPVFLLQGAA